MVPDNKENKEFVVPMQNKEAAMQKLQEAIEYLDGKAVKVSGLTQEPKDIEIGVTVSGLDEALEKAEEYNRLLKEAQRIAKELKKTKFKVELD